MRSAQMMNPLAAVDNGAKCKCGRRTIEGNCFGCGERPAKCKCALRDEGPRITSVNSDGTVNVQVDRP